MRILCFFLAAAMLVGCPAPDFGDCPPPPTLSYGSMDSRISGLWYGRAYLTPRITETIYDATLSIEPNREFVLVVSDDEGTYELRGIVGTDINASPESRIELGVACSEFDGWGPGSWLRGVYQPQEHDVLDEQYLLLQIIEYPYAAPIGFDGGLRWFFSQDPNLLP